MDRANQGHDDADLQTTARTDRYGVLRFDLPVGTADVEFDVVVVLEPKANGAQIEDPKKLSWAEFIEQTAGSIEDDSFRRHDQGEAEVRLEF